MPTWTSFLRSTSGGVGNSHQNTPTGYDSPDGHAGDIPPNQPHDLPPTLIGRDGERAANSPSRIRPMTSAGNDHHHRHNRSASHPLPKLFGRKKSTGNLVERYDAELNLDDGLVPVLDQPQSSTITSLVSGKKARAEEEDGKVQRKCMCCSSKVKVPKELDKFRCLACLCVNDLKPVEQQRPSSSRGEQGREVKGNRADNFPGGLPPTSPSVHLSVERTAAIIDRCVIAYLEARCRHEGGRPSGSRTPRTPLQPPEEKDNPHRGSSDRPRSRNGSSAPFTGGLVPSSPVKESHAETVALPTDASIRDAADYDTSTHLPNSTPPRESRSAPHGPGPPSSITRKPVPKQPDRKPPPPPTGLKDRVPPQRLHPNGGSGVNGEPSSRPQPISRHSREELEQRKHYDRVKTIFRPLEDYIVESFGEFRSLNTSFSTVKVSHIGRARSESNIVTPPPGSALEPAPSSDGLPQLDPKLLLIGDIGENSTWWTGKLNRNESDKAFRRKKVGEGSHSHRAVSSKSPNINWADLSNWYGLVHSAGSDWQSKVDKVKADGPGASKEPLTGVFNTDEIADDLAQARDHTIRALLKVTENILKRPGRPLSEPEDLRWLLIILANPSLYPSRVRGQRAMQGASPTLSHTTQPRRGAPPDSGAMRRSPKKPSAHDETQQHSGLVKRTCGLLAGTNDTCHRYLIGWFSRLDEERFTQLVDLVASFVTHRIARRNSQPRSRSIAADGGLIPDLSGSAMSTSAQLHSAMGLSGSVKKRRDNPNDEPEYASDWQIKAAARVMSLLFAANNIWQGKRRDGGTRSDTGVTITPQAKARRSGQLLHTSSFYNTLLDYGDILADFKAWETKRDRFAFCQYPFFLSMGSKIKILEYDARRQMEIKAREAYFDSVIRQRAHDGNFHLRVRRDCMVDDSLRQISEAVGSGPEELKKGLRVHFTGEEGVDAGGPRKEWFLMLVRDIFDPNYGLFVYDDESHTCYFNPSSFETSDQYYLVGALLGLAIYNSTILDIALPPFAFRKLLAAAPALAPGSASISSLTGTKGQMTYTLSDLAEFRPSLATGLRQLLDFDGDVQSTYCWNFVAPVERYGTVVEVPLIANGEATPVTNGNRHSFVEAYIRYLLDTAVNRQFEPFKRGFFQVCAGNALSLFRAEEIELLVRGSDEALDVGSLRAVAVYENWRHSRPPHGPVANPADAVPVVAWFWQIFAAASPERQRRLLTFITGTDRIPAVGATSLILKIAAGGDGWGGAADERARFPVARTCFNMLVLWPYDRRDVLEYKLWRAVEESEGFGLK